MIYLNFAVARRGGDDFQTLLSLQNQNMLLSRALYSKILDLGPRKYRYIRRWAYKKAGECRATVKRDFRSAGNAILRP
jgi:hypothetical protein